MFNYTGSYRKVYTAFNKVEKRGVFSCEIYVNNIYLCRIFKEELKTDKKDIINIFNYLCKNWVCLERNKKNISEDMLKNFMEKSKACKIFQRAFNIGRSLGYFPTDMKVFEFDKEKLEKFKFNN